MNFAIVGCGVIAFTHASAIKQLPEHTLYAVCDIIPDKADAFAEKHGAKKVYYDYQDVARDPAVDIVCVCVPSGTHGEVCIAMAQAGKHIVCEKPMEITVDRIRAVQKAVETAGVRMQCIFQRRFMPAAIAARRAIAEGKLGKMCLAQADLRYYRDQAYYNSAGWRGTWELDGGGALMNQGVHGVDLILWILGEPVESLWGRAETLSRAIAVEDTAAAVLTMKSGALCTIAGATTTYPGYSTTFSLHGELGSIVFSDDGILTWDFLNPEDAPPRPDVNESVGGAKNPFDIGITGHVRLLDDIAQAVRDDREPVIPPREADMAVQVITAIYESTRTGQPVRFA